MAQTNRLSSGGRLDRKKALKFTFNGQTYEGYQGDTLASALLANGVHFVARSWKYHRPRGIVTAGVEEPNAIVQLETGAYTVPNARATEVELYHELNASSVNASPNLENDRMAFNQKIARFIPAGFYYKTFKWPRSFWGKYEEFIRQAAGLGESPRERDPDVYDKKYAHCDVLVVGGGPAGLAAALVAGRAGLRVILADNQPELGGHLLSTPATVDGKPALNWVTKTEAELRQMPEVRVLTRSTVFGYQDQNLLTICERKTDHLPLAQRVAVRERIWKVRAKRVILATGAHERPIVFANNDLPGIMLASAISTYIHRYAVCPGKQAVIFTNNDAAYQAGIDLKKAGANVTIVDARPSGKGTFATTARQMGIKTLSGAIVTHAHGKRHIKRVTVSNYASGKVGNKITELDCDLLGLSGGRNPVIHLFAQSGGKAHWDEKKACFVPGQSVQAEVSAGACKGEFGLAEALASGVRAAQDTLKALGIKDVKVPNWKVPYTIEDPILPVWLAGDKDRVSREDKQFVDYQNDVSAADIYLAAREGYQSVEHVKRYTAMGFGTDQGKLGNINGMGILAEVLNQTIPQTGTTTFRPNYTPVSFGAIAGREHGDFLDPVRKTSLHEWHRKQGAEFEDVGQWKRPWYYPRAGEDLHAAVHRECLAVRNSVGMLDASTLGKIDIQGPDAVTLLNWLYTNPWNKLAVGRCRYGLMLDENGMVFDDGVTTRLGEQHFLMTTTTGGAARVMSWMERWLQTEWPHLKVYLTSVTDHWSTIAVVGPNSRRVLQKVCHDVDFANSAFPFMSYRQGTVAGVAARIMRISFSGELAYEVNVPSNIARKVWEAIYAAGKEYDITPYGTETMHVLRAEKGYIIIGQDTDGSMTPMDIGMGGLCAKSKDFLGKRSLARADMLRKDRKQLVGLKTAEPGFVLPEGSQIIATPQVGPITPMLGHVTSSYFSPVLNRSVALAVVKGGLDKMGQTVYISLASGKCIAAEICSTVFYDPQGERQNVE